MGLHSLVLILLRRFSSNVFFYLWLLFEPTSVNISMSNSYKIHGLVVPTFVVIVDLRPSPGCQTRSIMIRSSKHLSNTHLCF